MQVYQDSAVDLIGAPLNADNFEQGRDTCIVLLDDVRLCGCYLTRRRAVPALRARSIILRRV